jgi:hypothetical protein
MNDRSRLEQLRGLLARIERMPASRQRDWMLREVRARAVDVESGARPAAMRPLDPDAEPPVAPERAPARPRPAAATRPLPARPARTRGDTAPSRTSVSGALSITRSEDRVDVLEGGGVLSLDDLTAAGQGSLSPWVHGLRG